MKVSILIEEGIQQIVLTPQNDYEKRILKTIEGKDNEVSFKSGRFYQCQGGYVTNHNHPYTEDMMIVIKKKNDASA